MAQITESNTDLHVVIGAKQAKDGSWTFRLLSAPQAWKQAIDQWTKLDDHRVWLLEHDLLRSEYNYFMVRSVDDPRWAFLLKSYVDAVSRDGGRSQYGDSGRIKAAKAFAKRHGFKGAEGGWIYRQAGTRTAYDGTEQPNWKPFVQGWFSFSETLRHRNTPALLPGNNGEWYVSDLQPEPKSKRAS